jgi:hypothetical protein
MKVLLLSAKGDCVKEIGKTNRKKKIVTYRVKKYWLKSNTKIRGCIWPPKWGKQLD